MLTRCLAFAITIAVAATAHAGTPQEAYEKLWSKRMIDAGDSTTWQKPKGACVCMDGGANNARLGVLVKGSGLGTCGVPNFDGAGNVVSFAAICYTYDYIGK